MSVLIDDRPRTHDTAVTSDRSVVGATPLDEATMLAIARQLAGSEARWRPHVVHSTVERHPVRLVVTDTYEAWVIGWTEGQQVALHDHGDAAGALVVAEGVLRETILDDGLRARDLPAGSAVGLPAGLVHEVVASTSAHTTSIHVYSPPLTTMAFYDQRTGETVRTDHIDATDEPAAVAHRTVAPPAATPESVAIERYLESARARLDRVQPEDLAAQVAAGALVVDIRPESDRAREGELPGAVVVERIHLEWRLDPTSPDRLAEAGHGRRVVVVCNEGYASSLAAVALAELGLHDATDLVGGYRTWRRGEHERSAPAA